MHEYSIVQALLDRVGDEARSRGATRIHRLHVRIGELSGVEADLLATAYETFRQGTLCDSAELDIERVAARWVCPRCEAAFTRGDVLRCARCDMPARLAEGDEILLQRIEMEVP